MKLKFLFILLIFNTPFTGVSQNNIQKYIDQITTETIKAHMDTLASKSMEGRNTGEPGQKLAAQYIANEFSKYGLIPFQKNSENPYYQKFNLFKYSIGESTIYYNNLEYPAPIYLGNENFTGTITGEIIFAGDGNIKNIQKLGVQKESIFFFSESTKNAIQKVQDISSNYSINTFIVGIPFGEKFDESIFENEITDLKTFKELYFYLYYYILQIRNENDFNLLRQNNQLFPEIKIQNQSEIKILFVPEELAVGLFEKPIKELKKISKSAEKSDNILFKVKKSSFKCDVNYDPTIDTVKTENVIGYIDCKTSDETVILGAHYDHVGINSNQEINYGADDNASGTTAVLSIAKEISELIKVSVQLNKDIVFIAYSGEELGLLGSEYYVQNPLIPLSKTEALFNLDMIGRDMDDDPKNENRVFLLEWKGGKKYIKDVNDLNNEYTHLIVDTTPGFKNKVLWTFGSDHYSFAQKNISSITYFTGLHPDYHTPGDTPDKINYDKMHRIIQLVFLNIVQITTGE